MKPNVFQKAAAEAYGGGDYAWMAKSKNWRKDLGACGDALFAYVMIDLSDDELCQDWDDAKVRIDCAIGDLYQVLHALDDKREKETSK